MAASKVTFGKFDRLQHEMNCDGADIFRDGLPLGRIYRIVDWDYRGATRRASTVVGYKIEIGGSGTQLPDIYEEREFTSESALADARAWAREMAAK